ncbi:hypothetical protein KQI69_00215 [Eubacterium sp. MSJ-13]|uniref:hypothetical protein n=1 Tax=Eubacterium sp. MSJ-13 TaxID=2841513 RepID=UPI001C11BBE5|nr:hypothetical protein [Eubacterium sp. MSJ-13]MBU5477626.1 hypothetical protein [Eubacterium sp. MSJ-13]
MMDEDNRYALKPNDKDSDGIQIIRCINREIQSKYACSRFVGVCNDLDIFANVPLQSGKKFIMTYNNNFLDVARYYFASGNFLSDDEKTLSGQIKDKIVSMQRMERWRKCWMSCILSRSRGCTRKRVHFCDSAVDYCTNIRCLMVDLSV